MDTPQSTTGRSSHFNRDVNAPRRAYLDTYAKHRAGIIVADHDDQPESQPAQLTLAKALQQQQATEQPPAVAVMQPPSAAPVPAATIPSPATTQVTPVQELPKAVEVPTAAERKAHLDTLLSKHHSRVATAPLGEDTVVQPVVTEATQHLIEEATDNRIAANLDALYNRKPLTEHIVKNTVSTTTEHARTIITSALACGVLSVGILSFTAHYNSQPVVAEPIGSPIIEVEASVAATPTGSGKVSDTVMHANPTDPVKLLISSIGVNARVDGLGTTADGLIAVPKSYSTVGWYNKGATPGQAGPAVLVGHYTGGNGGVFDKLGDLQDGDLITVQNAKGETFTYKVATKVEYDRDKVPMAELFRKGSTSRLEIITCSGKWQSNNYNKRLVVTAELVQ